jgi:hypothetical protein
MAARSNSWLGWVRRADQELQNGAAEARVVRRKGRIRVSYVMMLAYCLVGLRTELVQDQVYL